MLLLGRAEHSTEILAEAVTLMETDPTNINVTLAAQVDLATAYATSGHLEHGCHTLGQAYRQLVDIGNRRGLDRAHQARRRLQPSDHDVHVRELDSLMAGG
jgi:hypothetical protein